jgi:hypothetical protein
MSDILEPFESFEPPNDLAYENPEGWTTIKPASIKDQTRWAVCKARVVTDGTNFVEIFWSEGATEYQDIDPDVGYRQVWPHPSIEYRAKKPT